MLLLDRLDRLDVELELNDDWVLVELLLKELTELIELELNVLVLEEDREL